MKKLLILFYMITCFLRISCEEKVRVNIIGYPKLDKFGIILNKGSDLVINGRNFNFHSLEIKPAESRVICDDKESFGISKIEIHSNGIIVFNSFAGDQEYEGDFFIELLDDKIRIINVIGIGHYFASVLGSEMGGGFSDEALKACAVAIRTYYYKRKKDYSGKGFDINNADGMDMVYRGASFATKRMYAAFNETGNLYLLDGNKSLALPLFHSTSGGIILRDEAMNSRFNDCIADPVLTRDDDESGKTLSAISPYFKFSEAISMADMLRIISSRFRMNSVKSVKLKYFIGTKCVDFIGFVYPDDRIGWMKAYEFVSLCQRNGFHNIRSIQFSIDKIGKNFYFNGNGFGHLCGMSQYGAEALARKGYDFGKILEKYYPEYTLKQINFPALRNFF